MGLQCLRMSNYIHAQKTEADRGHSGRSSLYLHGLHRSQRSNSWYGRGWIRSWALLFCLLNLCFAMLNAFGQSFALKAVWIGQVASLIPMIVIFHLNTRKIKVFFGKARDPEI